MEKSEAWQTQNRRRSQVGQTRHLKPFRLGGGSYGSLGKYLKIFNITTFTVNMVDTCVYDAIRSKFNSRDNGNLIKWYLIK